MIRVNITLDDWDSISSAGWTQIYIFTDSSSTGSFATRDGTMSLVSQQTGYVYIDTDGDSSTYYKTAFWQTGSTSAKSDALQGGVALYYADAHDVRQELAAGATNDAAIGTHDDDILYDMCEEASRFIDTHKRVEPGAYLGSSSTSARYFPGTGTDFQPIDYATSVDAVEVEETDGTYTAWTENTDFYTWPYNASSVSEPVQGLEVSRKSGSSKSVFIHGPRRVRVAAAWGISTTVPAAVRRAARILVARWYKRAQQGWQDSAANVELGQMTYTKDMDPEAERLLRSVFPTRGAGI